MVSAKIKTLYLKVHTQVMFTDIDIDTSSNFPLNTFHECLQLTQAEE